MTFLIILAGYIAATLVAARIIGYYCHKDEESYAYTAFALAWPILAIIFGWEWWVTGAERKATRVAHKAEKKRKAEVEARERKNRERDDCMRPWNMILRDPDASEEQKAFAREVLRGLALK